MISKKSLVAVFDKFIILTITAPNDNANQDPVQCAGGALAPRFWAKQLTLSQPGGQNIPTTVLRAPLAFQTLWQALADLARFGIERQNLGGFLENNVH